MLRKIIKTTILLVAFISIFWLGAFSQSYYEVFEQNYRKEATLKEYNEDYQLMKYFEYCSWVHSLYRDNPSLCNQWTGNSEHHGKWVEVYDLAISKYRKEWGFEY